MTEPLTIEIKPINGTSFRILEGGVQVLEMTEYGMYHSRIGVVEEEADDTSMPWEQREMDYKHFILKNSSWVLKCIGGIKQKCGYWIL